MKTNEQIRQLILDGSDWVVGDHLRRMVKVLFSKIPRDKYSLFEKDKDRFTEILMAAGVDEVISMFVYDAVHKRMAFKHLE